MSNKENNDNKSPNKDTLPVHLYSENCWQASAQYIAQIPQYAPHATFFPNRSMNQYFTC